ncbi:septal ring lytic transglycosylase RlpA family protein [Paracidovorax citrulli]
MRWQTRTLPLARRAARFGLHAASALVLAACAVTPTDDSGVPADSAASPVAQSNPAPKGKQSSRQTPRVDAAMKAAPADAPADTPRVTGSWSLFGIEDDEDAPATRKNSLEGLRADMGTFEQRGEASWYGKQFHGRKTANGERFDMGAMTAAHPSLPLDSWVLVRNLRNDKVAVLRINDRGPYHGNRVLDVSYRAAKHLGFVQRGSTKVEIRRLSRTELAALGPMRDPGMADDLTDGGGDGSGEGANGAQARATEGKTQRVARKPRNTSSKRAVQ